jgi:primosomal protein N' (replication factor Y)
MTMEPTSVPGFARVVVDVPLPQPLDYRLDPGLDAVPGCMCVVPVGRRKHAGLVVELADGSAVDVARLKDVAALLTDVAPLSRHWLDFTRFAADYYQHPWGEVALPALPPLLRAPPGPRFAQVLARLRRGTATDRGPPPTTVALNDEQARAVSELAAARGFGVHLLFGVTGSGKTEVYLRAIEDRLQSDPAAQVLLLVPEINLTPHLNALLRSRFGAAGVVTMHSGLAAGERSAAWLAAHEGRARIVVGTRLAAFASLPALALIVVDEEHDPSYKAGEGVRYSARDLAIKRAQMLGVPIVLGSATPSLETWAAAQAGRYRVLRLTQRAADDGARPPAVELVDLGAAQARPVAGLAPAVAAALADALARGAQSLVFLNRRGYAPVVACEACGWLSRCVRCSAFSVFHKTDRTLRCHHCGHAEPVPRACPTCGNQALHGVGHGTQRIEEALRQLLPAARVLRIDRDSTQRKHAAERAFDAVHAGAVDVLVGTQMVAKGHDFQRVALVVVLDPDGQLASHDFRAPERLFSTLMQVAGRAGRRGAAGRVLVQTRYPSHPLFRALLRHDYAAFADGQLAERRAARMPPFTHQALLRAEAGTMEAALDFLRAARAAAPAQAAVRLFDPVPMALQRLAGVERAQLLVEADRRAPLQDFLRSWLEGLRRARARVRWQIEVDPQEI